MKPARLLCLPIALLFAVFAVSAASHASRPAELRVGDVVRYTFPGELMPSEWVVEGFAPVTPGVPRQARLYDARNDEIVVVVETAATFLAHPGD